jgi:hypothetical protein
MLTNADECLRMCVDLPVGCVHLHRRDRAAAEPVDPHGPYLLDPHVLNGQGGGESGRHPAAFQGRQIEKRVLPLRSRRKQLQQLQHVLTAL